jgi:glycosyltransferase involved in cell wall biosynthesis
LKICIIGKFPPIQGGVAARTYWLAHDLASRGHEVHVVTNAKEAAPPFRIHMRRRDWKRCEATYDAEGSVKLHWTDPLDRSQYYIPLASPFVSKLAGIALKLHAERPFDVIYSHYLEPYGIAGHLAAQMARVPHVARMAGSDAGRLWRHPQLEPLYDQVLRSARTVIASGPVAGRAIKRGIDPVAITAPNSVVLPEDLFRPDGPTLDIAALRREVELESPELCDAFWGCFAGEFPCLGIYGKLGDIKGSFALLAALARLKAENIPVGLLAMSHGWPGLEQKFRVRAEELGVADRVLQIPFLPHWRVPEFLRSCLAVCCLEQDFPIIFHTPIIPREVLTCGKCLVASTEIIRKLPDHLRLPDGYGCVAIPDVQDVDALSARLAAMLRDPGPIGQVAARGHAFGAALQAEAKGDCSIEDTLRDAAAKRGQPKRGALATPGQPVISGQAAVTLPPTVLLDAEAGKVGDDPLFRLRHARWALAEGELAALRPRCDPNLLIVPFNAAKSNAKRARKAGSRFLAVLPQEHGEPPEQFLLSETAMGVLHACNGVRTAAEIAVQVGGSDSEMLRLIEELFVDGLLWLSDDSSDGDATRRFEASGGSEEDENVVDSSS